MKDSIRHTLLTKCALPVGAHVTVALSGGQDSVVLTEILLGLRDEVGFTLSAVHVHHGLRSASDEEEQWVRAYCAQRGLKLKVHHLNLDDRRGQSLEMAAREARYNVFAEYIDDGKFVATAHHLEDCMETMLINLSRGCGIKGLASIPYVRDGILRPMLNTPKERIDAFARQQGLSWVEDESNADIYYLRNFMRREIIPRLKSREDISFIKGVQTSLENLREEAKCLDDIAAQYRNEQRISSLTALPRPILWRVLKDRCPPLSRERFSVIANRLKDGSFKEQIAGDLYCTARRGKLYFEEKTEPIPPTPFANRLVLEDKIVEIQEIHSQFTHSDIDCDTISTKLIFRSKRTGDRFCPAGHTENISLSRLMQKKQLMRKDRLLLLVDGEEIVYAEGLGVSARHAAGSTTKKALRITIK